MAPGRGDEDGERKTSSPLPFVLAVVLAGFIIVDKSGLFAQVSTLDESQRGHQIDPVAARSPPPVHVSYASGVRAEAPGTEVLESLHRPASSVPSPASSAQESAPPRRASGAGGENGPQHNAMLFLFNAIMLGTMITHIKTLPKMHGLPETVVIFSMGMIYSAIFEGLGASDKMGVLGDSYNMWMSIDPHLLIFVMLPPLLAGDAMAMDTAIARKVSKQWMYLAGPGVLINGFLTAIFLWLYLPYNWPFLLCLTTGAILCATDPVAVVALLKELGAPPALTVQIQGESLLNDGTAIVLYQLSYNMLAGKNYEVSDVIVFLVKTAACAWGLGLLIGYGFYLWICQASNKLESNNTIIQISLTICCAYWSFIIAEGVFHISGVLATVGASLVLADKMWPVVVCKESLHTVWHMLEYLGNVIVFFLAGALTAKVMVTMSLREYMDLFIIYVVLMIIRGGMLIASRPIMNYFGKKVNPPQIVSIADVVVMTWGGLRGAVGLALAIQVGVERADNQISKKDADLVLFYVSGVAALTLLVNATTAPPLVKMLGITQMPETKKRVLLMLQDQLMQILRTKQSDEGIHHLHQESVARVENALNKMELWIERQSARPSSPGIGDSVDLEESEEKFLSRVYSSARALKSLRQGVSSMAKASQRASVMAVDVVKRLTQKRLSDLRNCEEILDVLSEVKLKFAQINSAHLKLLGELPAMPSDEAEAEVIKVVANEDIIDKQMVRAMHEVFLNLMYSNYWHLIDAGEVVPGTNEAEVVLTSIKLALSSTKLMLSDYENIRVCISERVQHKGRRSAAAVPSDSARSKFSARSNTDYPSAHNSIMSTARTGSKSLLAVPEQIERMVDSTWFNACCLILIMANAFFIALEDNYQNEENKADEAWLIGDMIFTCFFFLEFVLKCVSLHCDYFRDWWNILDFVLVLLSVTSVVLHFMAQDVASSTDVSAEGRLVRLARVLRVMRLLRLFRLVGFFRLLKAKLMHVEFSRHVAEQMQTLTILTCFIKAHMKSQNELMYYFTTANQIDMAELGRCVLESQVETYRALSLAVDCVQQLDEGMLHEVNNQKKSKALAEELEHLVQHAHLHHVITAQEAESVLDPVREHLRMMQARIWEMHFGYVRGSNADTRSRSTMGRSTVASRASEGDKLGELDVDVDARASIDRLQDHANGYGSAGDSIYTDILPGDRNSLVAPTRSTRSDVSIQRAGSDRAASGMGDLFRPSSERCPDLKPRVSALSSTSETIVTEHHIIATSSLGVPGQNKEKQMQSSSSQPQKLINGGQKLSFGTSSDRLSSIECMPLELPGAVAFSAKDSPMDESKTSPSRTSGPTMTDGNGTVGREGNACKTWPSVKVPAPPSGPQPLMPNVKNGLVREVSSGSPTASCTLASKCSKEFGTTSSSLGMLSTLSVSASSMRRHHMF